MPKLVNYSARIEFLRRACFLVVRDQGAQALSRRALAATLGISVNAVRRVLAEDADLRQLAAEEVDRRRARGRWGGQRDHAGADLAVFLLRRVLPDDESRIAEELVWLRLVLDAHRHTPHEDDSARALLEEHLIADRGYFPEDRGKVGSSNPAPDRLATRWAEHDALVDRVVAHALTSVGAHDDDERRRTRALVDGLVLSTCLGRRAPRQAVATLQHHIGTLGAAARVTA